MKRLKNKSYLKERMRRFSQKKLPSLLERKKSVLIRTLRRQGVLQAGIFGSYARGEQKKWSDVDILVKTKKGISLIDFVGIKHSAEKVLGKTVDLVEYSAIKLRIKGEILHDEVRII